MIEMPTKPRSGRPSASGKAGAADPGVLRAIESIRVGKQTEESFRTLFETYHRPVQSFFAKRISSPNECLDLTQETFLRVYKGLEGFRGDAPFGAWLFRIAWNVLKRSRESKRASRDSGGLEVQWEQAEPELDRAIARESEQRQAGEQAQMAAILHQEQQVLLREAIDELPAQRRKCMILWAYHELTYQQIASTLQLSLGTVKAHLAQAREQLENKISKEGD